MKVNEHGSAGKMELGNITRSRKSQKVRPCPLRNIRMDLEEIGINAGNWVDSGQDRDYWRALVNAALNLWVP